MAQLGTVDDLLIPLWMLGQPNGVAPLDASGRVPGDASAVRDRRAVLYPQYASSVVIPSAGVTASYLLSAGLHYYTFRTTSNNTYTSYVDVLWSLPDSFAGWTHTTRPDFTIDVMTESSNGTKGVVDVIVYDTANSVVQLDASAVNLVSPADSTPRTCAFNFVGGTFTPGSAIRVNIAVTTRNNATNKYNAVGALSFNYQA